MTDHEWYSLVKDGLDDGWRLVWERVVEPESKSLRSAGMMQRFSLTAGDLMGMLYEDMIGRRKIDLYRDDGGSFQGWLRRYVRGYVLAADPSRRGEISIESGRTGQDGENSGIEIPSSDTGIVRNEAWNMTHLCFRDLWNSGPEKAYVMLLKTRFHLSSEETCEMLGISSPSNVDQIFSRAVKFMRNAWARWDAKGFKV